MRSPALRVDDALITSPSWAASSGGARSWFARPGSRLAPGLALVLAGLVMILGAGCARRVPVTRHLPPINAEPLPPLEVREVTLGPGDEVEVFVWGEEELSRQVKVTGSGILPYPLIGDVKVSGMTPEQVRDRITADLSQYLKDPKVSVSVLAIKTHKVYVLGEVQRPGVYGLDPFGTSTVAEAISQAGGLTQDAKRSEVLLVRGDRRDPGKVSIQPLDFDALLRAGDLRENPALALGDIIYVPPRAMATVQREARRLVDILLPVIALSQLFLNFQDATIQWGQFVDALSGKDVSGGTDGGPRIVIIPPSSGGGVSVPPSSGGGVSIP